MLLKIMSLHLLIKFAEVPIIHTHLFFLAGYHVVLFDALPLGLGLHGNPRALPEWGW